MKIEYTDLENLDSSYVMHSAPLDSVIDSLNKFLEYTREHDIKPCITNIEIDMHKDEQKAVSLLAKVHLNRQGAKVWRTGNEAEFNHAITIRVFLNEPSNQSGSWTFEVGEDEFLIVKWDKANQVWL